MGPNLRIINLFHLSSTTRMTNVLAVIQARMSSQRLPGKIVRDVYGKCLLERVVLQTRRMRRADGVVVTTSVEAEDDVTELICQRLGVECFRGSLDDVRSRFLAVGRRHKAEILVRVTADNPLTEPRLADALVEYLVAHPEIDYCQMRPESIAKGTGSEAFRRSALEAVGDRDDPGDREHVTPAIEVGPRAAKLDPPPAFAISGVSLTIDTLDDYAKLNRIFARYAGDDDLLQHLIADCRAGVLPPP
jgi:spore coat polysaccharide biosynthesis protein SpsF